jgi:thiol:disulfide interchange protein
MPPDERRSTRARPVALSVVTAGLLAARIALGVYDGRHPPPPGGLVKWTSIENAQIAASIEKRPILYDFSAIWCEPCRRMEREVFANATEAGFINGAYVPVRIADEDQSPAALAVRTHHGVDGLPTLLVVYAGDAPPARIEGYAGKRRTVSFLRAAVVPRKSVRPDF